MTVDQLLVGHYQRQQSEQRVERQLQRRQREQRQQGQQQLRAGSAWRLVTGPEELYSFRAFWRQYRACRRNKRNTRNQLAFEIDAEANLFAPAGGAARAHLPPRALDLLRHRRAEAARGLRRRLPRPGRASPAGRASGARVRAALHPRLVRLPARQGHARGQRPADGLPAPGDRNGRRPAWALKLDVASFFPSIDKATSTSLARASRDPELRWLTRRVLFHDPTADYAFRAGARRTPPPGHARLPGAAAQEPLRQRQPAAACRSATSPASSGRTSI